jgi:DNA-binding winged helix-turn-helix (wHTH) protein
MNELVHDPRLTPKWKIGEWVADPETDTIQSGDKFHKLERRPMEVLIYLAERAGRVISKDELIEGVWGRVAVSDHAVAMVISQLRRVLGDDAREPRCIETITKRGYKLLMPVELLIEASTISAINPGAASPVPEPEARRWAVPIWVAVLVLSVGAVIYGLIAGAATTAVRPLSRILMADFENETGDPKLDHVAFSLSARVAINLQQGDSRAIVRWKEDGSIKLQELKRIYPDASLTLISGSIQRAASGPVLRVRTYDHDDKNSQWSGVYPIGTGFSEALIQTISRDISRNHRRPMFAAPSMRQYPDDAHDRFWRATWLLAGDGKQRQSYEELNKIVELYPDYARAHQLLASILILLPQSVTGRSDMDSFALARSHLDHAIRLEGVPSGLIENVEAWYSIRKDHDLDAALQHAKAATELNSSSATMWQTLARMESLSGNYGNALRALDQARLLDLANVSILSDRILILYAAGQYSVALEWAEQNKEKFGLDFFLLALCAHGAGDKVKAMDYWLQYLESRGVAASIVRRFSVQRDGSANDYVELLGSVEGKDRMLIESAPLAALHVLAGNEAGAVETLKTISWSREDPWNFRLHQVHLFAKLRADQGLKGVWLDTRLDKSVKKGGGS